MIVLKEWVFLQDWVLFFYSLMDSVREGSPVVMLYLYSGLRKGQGAVACHALCCCLLSIYSFGLMDFLASFPLMHQRGWISALRSPITASPGCFWFCLSILLALQTDGEGRGKERGQGPCWSLSADRDCSAVWLMFCWNLDQTGSKGLVSGSSPLS